MRPDDSQVIDLKATKEFGPQAGAENTAARVQEVRNVAQ